MQPVRFMLRWILSGCAVAALAALAALPLAGEAAAQKSAWPSAANTGVPAGITLTTVTSTTRLPAGVTVNRFGDLIVDAPGVVLSGLDIRGSVYINASNVTLINSKVSAGGDYVIRIATGVAGTLIQNVTISGTASSPEGSKGIAGSGTFIANSISNVEDGIFLLGDKDTLIQDNYIHDLKATGSPHYDGIQIEGSVSNVTIRHNTVINDHGQTSAVMIDNYFGPISNITVDNNLLVGGGYTIYVDGQFSGGPVTGVSITNNHMGQGHWGITNFNKTSPAYAGNVNDGASVAASLPTTGQPPAPSGPTPPPAGASGRRGLRPHQRRLHCQPERRRWQRAGPFVGGKERTRRHPPKPHWCVIAAAAARRRTQQGQPGAEPTEPWISPASRSCLALLVKSVALAVGSGQYRDRLRVDWSRSRRSVQNQSRPSWKPY